MITFKQFLSESRSAPLYHATLFYHLVEIEKRGLVPATWHTKKRLNIGTSAKIGTKYVVNGVSATRNLNFAKYWGPIILQLDQKAISNRYKIVPFQYYQFSGKARSIENLGHNISGDNEYEEFIITKNPIPFKYVTRVIINKSERITPDDQVVLNKQIKYIEQKYGASFIVTT